MKERNKRVLVGMSGGIDSTATCLMLQEQGYEIVGVTMRVWGDEPQDARELAARMGIEHYVADERIPFKETIVRNFIDEYKQGRTPNPCVMCNPLFKFRVLADWADKLNCAYIATGHYSRLEERNGHIYIVAGEDDKKDQSYLIWQLGQDVQRRCNFPLGDYTKIKVREYLAEKGYEIYATAGTATFLNAHGVNTTPVYWPDEKPDAENNVMKMIAEHKFDLIVNIPKNHTKRELTNGYKIRRGAIDHNIPLITNARLASAFIEAFCEMSEKDIQIKSWQDYK